LSYWPKPYAETTKPNCSFKRFGLVAERANFRSAPRLPRQSFTQ
jgi:hypothetical protein